MGNDFLQTFTPHPLFSFPLFLYYLYSFPPFSRIPFPFFVCLPYHHSYPPFFSFIHVVITSFILKHTVTEQQRRISTAVRATSFERFPQVRTCLNIPCVSATKHKSEHQIWFVPVTDLCLRDYADLLEGTAVGITRD